MERFKHPAPYVTPYRPPMPHPYGVVPTVDPPQSQWDVPPQPITNNYGVTATPNPPQTQWDVQPHLIPPHPYDDTAPDAGNATSMAPSTPDADWWGQKPPYANDVQPTMAPPPPVTPYDHMLYQCGMMARMLGDVHPSGLPQQFDDLNNAAPFGVGNFHVTQPTPPPQPGIPPTVPPDATNNYSGVFGSWSGYR